MRLYLFYLIITGFICSPVILGSKVAVASVVDLTPHVKYEIQNITKIQPNTLHDLNSNLKSYLERGDLVNSGKVIELIKNSINQGSITDSLALCESYYFIGIHNLFVNKYSNAIRFLELSKALKESRKEFDDRYANTLYNLGVAYNGIGDLSSHVNYAINALEIEKKLFGFSSPKLIKSYTNLILAYLGLNEYEKSLELSRTVINIASANPGSMDIRDMIPIYINMGVMYMQLADYSKAKVYLEKSESFYHLNHLDSDDNYFSLLNNLAITCSFLGLKEKSDEYYERGIKLALSINSSPAYNFINSYSIVLAKNGDITRGGSLLHSALLRSRAKLGEDSRDYFVVLFNYADYLREFSPDINKSLEYYKLCLDYLGKNNRNILLKDQIYLGYSSALAQKGETYQALDLIQAVLFPEDMHEIKQGGEYKKYDNPDISDITADRISLRILKLKYRILWSTFNKTHDQKILETASSTARLIVEVLEKVRINISEEDSRLILGDRYRDSYLNAIRDFTLLYNRTGDPAYLDEAFEFMEKSKVAALLASTRELKAAQFNIPADISELERKLQRDIILFSARITEEVNGTQPDTSLMRIYKDNILKCTEKRDSLIEVFEKKYPGYYAFKYNTHVIKPDDISGVIGRHWNYINYVASDTMLYIFVANRKNRQLLAFPVDSSFYSDIRLFRNLLSKPSPSDNARTSFENYQNTGYRLYQKVIEPIRPYLISNKLLISPDNILSYIPFETLPASVIPGERILYSQLNYLMNEFDISYTYSATFMAETVRSDSHLSNSLIAFAPNYFEPIDVNSVFLNRQVVDGKLPDLPYARQEAEYVASVTNGKLYENDDAKKNVYKTESHKYDIIHLAMHTILNDKDPMYSTLIFSSTNDTANDRFLKTYEVYSIPLKARMVVLSSCNSGAGYLYSGEGIISLARGFIYSGSESVVMAMWEIEDKSGTELVKQFYDNLKKGYSKSLALRSARIKYLKESDQLRSHPYFWSSLVVYGDNNPLYYSSAELVSAAIVILILAGLLLFYLRSRKYS
jgi:CHAT domain-containing protein